jgi:hypothetical protein
MTCQGHRNFTDYWSKFFQSILCVVLITQEIVKCSKKNREKKRKRFFDQIKLGNTEQIKLDNFTYYKETSQEVLC